MEKISKDSLEANFKCVILGNRVDNIIILRGDRHSRYFNEAQIEIESYISKDSSDLSTQYYIYL